MNVLHLCAGNLYGGVETYLVTLAWCRDLCPEMRPSFALCFPGRLQDELVATSVPVHDLGAVRVSRPWTILKARGRLKRLLKAERFDAVVAHSSWPHAILAPVVRKAGIRLAHALHGQIDRRHWLNRWAARTKPDVVLANSEFIARDAAGWFGTTPVHTCYLPVPQTPLADRAAIRAQVRAELNCPPESVVILQASRLEEWKGQRTHVEALGRLREDPSWTAWFAGGAQRASETAFLAELQSLASRLGIAERVRFLGQRSDVSRLMAAADIYCQPNDGPEPFGLVFVEALAAGLPVITSGFGGAVEIVGESCGLGTPPRDSQTVAGALRSLLGDPARRAKLGRVGPVRARQLCDPARQLDRLREVLTPC